MKIGQVRLGFATNSSSSHSVILASRKQSDQPPNRPFEFGWDNFILASDQEKRDYIFIDNFQQFEGTDQWDEFLEIVQPSEGWKKGVKNGYIDHQSRGLVYGKGLAGVEEILNIILNPEVIILGGNDNEDYDFGIFGTEFSLKGKIKNEPEGVVIFDPINGTKIHLFDTKEYIATSPELVDIKITDWCDLGCKFCYQDSTKKGKPADLAVLKGVLDDLSSAGTWEVALGGGEPASHPDFLEILKYANDKGIVPNYTTRNYKALYSEKFMSSLPLIGSIGLSVATLKDVQELIPLIKEEWSVVYKMSIQIPMGTQTEKEFDQMIHLLSEKNKETPFFSGLILLGYKMVGRGSRTANSRWYEEISLRDKFENIEVGTISIDTEMARNVKSLKKEISSNLYMENEGRVSCYIDAVSMKIAPSSYCDERFYHKYDYNIKDIFNPIAKEYRDATKTPRK